MKHTLGPCIRELRQCGMEQLVLFPERLILFIDVCLRDLEGHILVCDFGDIGEEEDAREQEDKYADGEVDPLHAL